MLSAKIALAALLCAVFYLGGAQGIFSTVKYCATVPQAELHVALISDHLILLNAGLSSGQYKIQLAGACDGNCKD